MNSLRLKVLGRFEARLPSGEVLLLPTRKVEVLLTYLSMTPGQPHSRDRLMNLLWSDRGEDQARNSLRQTLSALKKALEVIDPLPLQVDRTTVSVLAESIEMDTFELENSDATTDAINLYRGEFLEGIVIKDPGGEEWLTSERARYRRIAVEALENLLTSQREAGEMDAAVETGERLVGLDPLRETAWRYLMKVYVARGERSQALIAYNRCMEMLEKELGIEPEQETRELQAVIRDGNFELALTDIQPESMLSVNHAPAVTEGLPVPASSQKPSIVVLPFVSLGTKSNDEYFADGLSQDVITILCCYRELFVIDHKSAFAYRDARTDAGHFASELGVEYLVKGNIRRSGNQVRISAQLIEAATGKTIWAEHIDRKFDELFELEDEVAAKIALNLVSHIEDESRVRAVRKHPQNMTAFDCVIRARKNTESYDPEQNASARRLLEQAIELDPEYAAAYAYLASSFCTESESPWGLSRQEALERAVTYARKAVALDEFDSYAHVAMGWAYMNQKKYDLAEAHLDRAIECNPNDYGAFCVKSWLLSWSGRASEVPVCGTTALHLNPLAPDNCLLAFVIAHYTESKYETALEMLARIQEPDENSEAWRAACLAQLGRDDEAHTAAANVIDMGGDFIQHPDWLRIWAFKDPQDLQHFIDGLNKSGVLQNSAGAADKTTELAGSATDITNLSSKNTPSIAVLPFQNMSGDPEQEYFADGMSEEIITALSRVPGLIVISRNSTSVYKKRAVDVRQVGRELDVGFVLEGSIRKMEDSLRITAQLVNTQSGDHVWAERYDRKLDDIFAIQDEITHNIVVELQIKLVTGEYLRLIAKGTNSIEAWELVIRSVPLTETHVCDDAMLARQLLGRALELDNNYAAAWALLGWIYWEEAVWEWSSEPEKSMQRAFEAAQKSLSLDEHHPDSYSLLGHIFMKRGDINQAISMCEKAVELAPGDAEAMALLANILIDSGRVKEGSQKIQKALRLCPFPPPWYLVLLGVGFHLDGDNEAAISTLEQAMERELDSNLGRPWLASTLVEMGKLDEARVVAQAALDIDPTFSTMGWAKMFKAKSHARLKDNLLAAGFPE